MADRTQITDSLIHDSIVRSLEHVFRTMLHYEVSLAEETAATAVSDLGVQRQVVGVVGFVGLANGVIYLCFPEDFAKIATGRILGISLPEVEMHGVEALNDAIGELTNMTVGGFKNALCDVGFPCKLTLPTIVRANNLSLGAVKTSACHVFRFDCLGHRVVADIQMKSE